MNDPLMSRRMLLQALGREGPKAASGLRLAARRLSETGSLSALLREAEEETGEMAGMLPPSDPSTMPDLFAGLRKLYTMASERQLHDGFAGVTAAPSAEAEPVRVEDEFELF